MVNAWWPLSWEPDDFDIVDAFGITMGGQPQVGSNVILELFTNFDFVYTLQADGSWMPAGRGPLAQKFVANQERALGGWSIPRTGGHSFFTQST